MKGQAGVKMRVDTGRKVERFSRVEEVLPAR